MTHNHTLFPLPVTSTFLARLLERNISTQDKLNLGTEPFPQEPHSYIPPGSIFLSIVCSILAGRLLQGARWCWCQGSCGSSPAPCDSRKQIGGTRHLVSMDVYTWPPRLGPFLPLFLCGSPSHTHMILQQHWKCPSGLHWQQASHDSIFHWQHLEVGYESKKQSKLPGRPWGSWTELREIAGRFTAASACCHCLHVATEEALLWSWSLDPEIKGRTHNSRNKNIFPFN